MALRFAPLNARMQFVCDFNANWILSDVGLFVGKYFFYSLMLTVTHTSASILGKAAANVKHKKPLKLHFMLSKCLTHFLQGIQKGFFLSFSNDF